MFQMGEKAADGERARRDAMAKAAAPYVHPTLARHAGDAGKIVFRTPLRFVLCANKKSPDAKMQSFVNRVRVIS